MVLAGGFLGMCKLLFFRTFVDTVSIHGIFIGFTAFLCVGNLN